MGASYGWQAQPESRGMPERYQAFGCQAGNRMMRAQADRAKIR